MKQNDTQKTFHGKVLYARPVVRLLILFIFHLSLFSSPVYAEIYDKVAAVVDDQAITLSEFREQYEKTKKFTPDVTGEQVINTIINRLLILREAKKIRIDAPSDEEIIRDFIDLKVRAFIKLGESEIEDFYKKNLENFQGKSYEDARGEIEKYLSEKELNERLKETLKELRKNAYVRIIITSPTENKP